MSSSKKINYLGITLLAGILVMAGCKKESNDPITPAFTITSAYGIFPNGKLGLQFYATCTNTEVTMAYVSISDPVNYIRTYSFNNASYIKNLRFNLQENNVGYEHKAGTWKFKLVGTLTADNTAFSIEETYEMLN